MKNSIHILVFAVCLLLASTPVIAQDKLPRTTPEKENISVKGIKDYLHALKDNEIEIHSIMVVRNGKVAYEEWFNGASPDSVHVMHSVSKSFTATAIGFAIDEGLIGLDDKVISFFPDKLPDTVSPYLAQLSIRDLITMSVGQAKEPARTGKDWIKDFLVQPITTEPGTHFYYNSMGSFMLSAIVQKVTGQTVFDYLTPRLFDPLHIHDIYWEKNSQGINTGGWGLYIKTEDMAKFGLLFLQTGVWNGKQILPKGWVEQASAYQIESYPGDAVKGMHYPENDWGQGYCFQMWRCKYGAYRADGAFGQFIFVIPYKNTVIAITSNTNNMGKEIGLVWDYLLPALK
ncbi:serine hydrolase [Bacteroidia bacterium]|nr:serine hydrolase [Bacteroidia bacterium]GHT48560.1 serine hydrolase [Bacteroidia bacterium]